MGHSTNKKLNLTAIVTLQGFKIHPLQLIFALKPPCLIRISQLATFDYRRVTKHTIDIKQRSPQGNEIYLFEGVMIYTTNYTQFGFV